jgi:ActR/RegA family two-component response regulator
MELIENCIKAGALAYITKPFNTDEILQAVSYAFDEK